MSQSNTQATRSLSTSKPYEVVVSSCEVITLNLNFADLLARSANLVKVDYFVVNFYSGAENNCIRICGADMIAFFKEEGNENKSSYPYVIKDEDLPFGSAGAQYHVHLVEEQLGGLEVSYDVVLFVRPGSPEPVSKIEYDLGNTVRGTARENGRARKNSGLYDISTSIPTLPGKIQWTGEFQKEATTMNIYPNINLNGTDISKLKKDDEVIVGDALNNQVWRVTEDNPKSVNGVYTIKCVLFSSTGDVDVSSRFNVVFVSDQHIVDPMHVGRENSKFRVSFDSSKSGGTGIKNIIYTHTYHAAPPLNAISGPGPAATLQVVRTSVPLTAEDERRGFKEVNIPFPNAAVDTIQTTHFELENKEGRNSAKSETIVTSNSVRVKIAKDSIQSASYDQVGGVAIVISPDFYTESDSIKFSVLARKSSPPSSPYSTTNIINVEYNAAIPNDNWNLVIVNKIASGAETTTDLQLNVAYDFVLVATDKNGGIEATDALNLFETDDPSQSEISNVVKGQQLVNFAAPLPTLSGVVRKDPLGLRIALNYSVPELKPTTPPTKNYQYFVMTKISKDGVREVIATDFKQWSPVALSNPPANANANNRLSELNSLLVPSKYVDDDSTFEFAAFEAFPLLPSMLSCFPGLKDDRNVKILGNPRLFYYLMNGSSPRTITFQNMLDPSKVDKIDKISASIGRDANGIPFIGVCMSHSSLENLNVNVTGIQYQVSNTDCFSQSSLLYISNFGTFGTGVPEPSKTLSLPNSPLSPGDIEEYRQLWVYNADGTNWNPGMSAGLAYFVRAVYIVNQVNFTDSVIGVNYAVANTQKFENNASIPPPGPNFVNAVPSINQQLNVTYTPPAQNNLSSAIVSAQFDLYGSDVKNKPFRSQVVSGSRRSVRFDLAGELLETGNYNVFVTLTYSIAGQLVVSTPTHTTVSFSMAPEILRYEIVRPPATTNIKFDKIATLRGLTFRVFLARSDASSITVYMPHDFSQNPAAPRDGFKLNLSQQGNTPVWSSTFDATSQSLTCEPIILAVGASGYAISPNPCSPHEDV
jgi:hypothetical protein